MINTAAGADNSGDLHENPDADRSGQVVTILKTSVWPPAREKRVLPPNVIVGAKTRQIFPNLLEEWIAGGLLPG
ncbi:MAG: hypothetical protein R3337_10775, partial [Gammaproteobacteria bacterium]|nr:hypothetical protein [Gammaproteobacteria bacterium]